jgi:hypothetical protein
LAQNDDTKIDGKLAIADIPTQDLESRAEFFKSQRLFENEILVLRELQKRKPDSTIISNRLSLAELDWAQEVVTRRTALESKAKPDELEPILASKISETKQVLDFWLGEFKILCNSNIKAEPETFAILFYQMDSPEHAISILELAKNSHSVEWLFVEFYLCSRQYIHCLEMLTKVESTYAQDAETPMAVAYAKAQAFYGLGQKVKGIEILRDIVTLRPSYRSADALLRKWEAADEKN